MSDPITRLNDALEGRYRIESELGEGGMATVYLADDLKHERKVALKVLKPELAAVVGADRFLAEIKTTANLQHPHILPLFDSGEADGFLFYVMPYVEGESLRERLDREHQLPVDDAVRIAANVAEALDYAHRQGVIHRDIKPANVLLQDGKPVISDFGIALAVGVAGGGRLTETGLSLGTPHYMSPEQATGDQSVGLATDIYALGCVLYEMLVGEPPYTGSTAQAILGKIIAGDAPAPAEMRASIPANVDAVIRKALERLPADRFSTVARLAEALGDPGFEGSGSRAAATSVARQGVFNRIGWMSTTLLASALAVWGWSRPQASQPVVRTQISLGQRLSVLNRRAYPLDISRDGTRLVYLAEESGVRRLFVRELAETTPHVLGGTEGAQQPFFSPDGSWVGFFASGELQRVAVSGGAPIAITQLPPGETRGASWGDDASILFTAGPNLYTVPEIGGAPTAFEQTFLAEDARVGADSVAEAGPASWPHHLPDGEHALVSIRQGTGVLDLRTGEIRFVFNGTQARYLASGHLLFHAGEGRIRAVSFDLPSLRITGAQLPALESVFRGPGGGAASFAISDTGTLVYVAGGFERTLWLVDGDGGEAQIAVLPRDYRSPRVSPDGTRVAVLVDPRPSGIWMVDLERAAVAPVATDRHHPSLTWAPDGERLAFPLDGDMHWILWRLGGEPQRAARRPLSQFLPSWSIDDQIVVREINPETGSDLIALNLEDSSTRPFLATPASESAPAFSPDGRWIAYTSDVSGAQEVYVRPFPGPGPRHSVSVAGGTEANWPGDGRELFYRRGDQIMAVGVVTTPDFSPGSPRQLFDASAYDLSQFGNWDVRPGGGFVMVKGDPSMLRRLEVVQNFSEELRQRVGN